VGKHERKMDIKKILIKRLKLNLDFIIDKSSEINFVEEDNIIQ